MASITIRRLDDAVKEKLRVRAAEHGVSMEEEARELLKVGLARTDNSGLTFSQSIRKYFEPFGGVDLEIPGREPIREPPDFT